MPETRNRQLNPKHVPLGLIVHIQAAVVRFWLEDFVHYFQNMFGERYHSHNGAQGFPKKGRGGALAKKFVVIPSKIAQSLAKF